MLRILTVLIFIMISGSSMAIEDNSRLLTESYCRNLTSEKIENFYKNQPKHASAYDYLSLALESNIYNSCKLASYSGLTQSRYEYRSPFVCLKRDKSSYGFNIANQVHIDVYFNFWFKSHISDNELPEKNYITDISEGISFDTYILSNFSHLHLSTFTQLNPLDGRHAVYIENDRYGKRKFNNLICFNVNELTKK